MGETTATVLKLTGDNWPVWKFQSTIILKGKGLFDLVEGTRVKPSTPSDELTKWLKDDARAQEMLVTRMDQGPLTHILSCTTSKDMWNKLKTVYDRESAVSIHLLQQRFFLMEFDSTVSNFISKIEEIKTKLSSTGETLSDKMIMTKILMSLPEHFRHFRSAWESVPSDNQTLEELTSRLLLEEERMRPTEAQAALFTKNQGPEKRRCHICSKVGHIAKNCYLKNKQTTGGPREEKPGQKFCTYCKKSGHLFQECYFRKGKFHSKNKVNKTEIKPDDRDANAFMTHTRTQTDSNKKTND